MNRETDGGPGGNPFEDSREYLHPVGFASRRREGLAGFATIQVNLYYFGVERYSGRTTVDHGSKCGPV